MQEKNSKKIKLIKYANNLRKLRIAANETQMSLSHKLGIDHRGYQRMESDNPPDIKFTTILKILEFYKIKFEDLLK